MTRERNYDMNYPMYGGMQGAGMPMPQGMPYQGGQMQGMAWDKQPYAPGNEMSSLKEQLKQLEKRVSHLESMCGGASGSNKYTDSNFYMV